METTHFQDPDIEHLEPGEQPVQRRLVAQRTVHHSLHRFHRGGQLPEVQQGVRGEDPRGADLVGRPVVLADTPACAPLGEIPAMTAPSRQ